MTLPATPEVVTACNCSLCRRLREMSAPSLREHRLEMMTSTTTNLGASSPLPEGGKFLRIPIERTSKSLLRKLSAAAHVEGFRRHVRMLAFLLSATATLLAACAAPGGAPQPHVNLAAAENLIDAFYSFDRTRLTQTLESAKASQPEILYYQGWAEGGTYRVVKRVPCVQDDPASAHCSITVKDDLMGALGIPFDVTDTFHISFARGRIVTVKTRSNDLPVFDQALKWVRRERPESIRVACEGFFAGGPTPGDCVRATVRGFSDFARSKDFPPPPYGYE